jgi:MFS family permease
VVARTERALVGTGAAWRVGGSAVAVRTRPDGRTRRVSSVVAWSLAGLAVALLVAGTVLSLLGPWTDGPRLEPHDRAMFTAFLMYAFAGALVASRRPANPIGWLLLADGLLFELAGFSAGYAHAALFARSLALPAGAVIAWAGDAVWNPILAVSAVVVLLFPTGQLRSPRWRPVLLAGVVCAAAAFAADAFAPGPLGGSLSRIDNPLGIADASGALTVAGFIAAIGGPLLLLAALCSALLRFRESAGTDRRQMQVLAYAVALLAVGLV